MNAQRIAGLLREREANQKAMRAASARFNPPATPAPTVTYRGPFGPIEMDVDGDWIRELLPDQGAARGSASCCGSTMSTMHAWAQTARPRA